MKKYKYFVINKNVGVSALIPSVFIEFYDKISLSLKQTAPIEKNTEEIPKIKTGKLLLQLPLAERLSIYKTFSKISLVVLINFFVFYFVNYDFRNDTGHRSPRCKNNYRVFSY